MNPEAEPFDRRAAEKAQRNVDAVQQLVHMHEELAEPLARAVRGLRARRCSSSTRTS